MVTIFDNRHGDVVEIIIRDNNLKKIGTWKFNTTDKKLAVGILNHIEKKYGFKPTTSYDELTNKIEKEKELKKEIDWLSLSSDW